MTLKKERIVDELLIETGLKRSEASRVTNSVLEIIKRTLESGEEVLISGFGKFCVKAKKARRTGIRYLPLTTEHRHYG